MDLNAEYWNNKYLTSNTPWDTGAPTPPLRDFIDSLDDHSLGILIPGAGNGHEVRYLYSKGFKNIWVCDWAPQALAQIKTTVPDIPSDRLVATDFFNLRLEVGLILEQTFFCSFHPSRRRDYVLKSADLLHNQGRIAGVLFAGPFPFEGPPFGGSKSDYRQLFAPCFEIEKLEHCYNSIKPRNKRELFFNFIKK